MQDNILNAKLKVMGTAKTPNQILDALQSEV
jgi:hypothetical protein